MKTLILFLSLALIKPQIKADSVWLCMGNYSHAYHSTTMCRGLRNCKGKEIRVSLYDAINKYHRHAYGYCER
jgi:hypothetical protein